MYKLDLGTQRYLSSGDSYRRYTDTILEDCPSPITWSDTVEGAFHRICSMLSHCNENGLVFNPNKFRFARREVDFTTPSNISEVRLWYGFVNQVTYFFYKTVIMSPFRHLLSPNSAFEWTDELDEAFAASKEKIIELIQKGVY